VDSPSTPARIPENIPAQANTPSKVGVLPSGRTITLKVDGTSEEIEVRSASGNLEVSISMTDAGPVLSLRGAKLQIESTDTVSVNCRQFELNTTHGLSMHTDGDLGLTSSGEVHLKSAGQTFIDGDYVNLNCLDRQGYHDEHAIEADPDPPNLLPKPPDTPATPDTTANPPSDPNPSDAS